MPDLFDHAPTPRARNTDPWTSHDSAHKAKNLATGHGLVILRYLDGISPWSASYVDISASTGLEKHAVGRRLKELEESGLIERNGTKKLENGRNGTLWGVK